MTLRISNLAGRLIVCAVCISCSLSPCIASAPSAPVEEIARSYVTEKSAAERLKVRRDLLEATLNGPRTRNPPRDEAALRNLQTSASEFRTACAAAEREWLGARADLWNVELARYDRSIEHRDSGALAATLHWSERIGWWVGPVAVILLLVLFLHDFRHSLRRALGAYSALAVVLLLGILGIGTAMGMSIMLREPTAAPLDKVDPPQERFDAAIAQATRERATLKSEVDQLEHDLEFDSRSPGDSEIRRASRELAECAALHAFLVRSRRADIEAAADLTAKWLASADDAMTSRVLRAGTGVGLLALAGLGAWIRTRAIGRQRRRRANTCPACCQRSALRVDRRSGVARCNVTTCGFDLSMTHCSSPRLRVAVLGPPRSGKTHLIAAASRELTAGYYSIRGSTTPSAATTAIEQIAGAILDERRPPAPTPPDTLPMPLVVRDRDPLGRSDLLVTVGEGTSPATGKRAADGYVLTIDATQPLESQRKWLAELIAARILGRTPLVLALTKIDLVGGRETGRFFSDLAALEPTGRTTSKSVIRQRSARTARFVSVLWPGWDVAADLGRRDVPWFPVSPVGLNEPGEPDLRRRVIEPFATLEPLLGLIHTCGYPVLA
jgi:hypothetical protein